MATTDENNEPEASRVFGNSRILSVHRVTILVLARANVARVPIRKSPSRPPPRTSRLPECLLVWLSDVREIARAIAAKARDHGASTSPRSPGEDAATRYRAAQRRARGFVRNDMSRRDPLSKSIVRLNRRGTDHIGVPRHKGTRRVSEHFSSDPVAMCARLAHLVPRTEPMVSRYTQTVRPITRQVRPHNAGDSLISCIAGERFASVQSARRLQMIRDPRRRGLMAAMELTAPATGPMEQ